MNTASNFEDGEQPKPPLFVKREKIHPKAVKGFFRRLKWAALIVLLGIYYIVPWLRWDRGPDAPDQAVLVDLAGRRLYFFFIEIWPQEVYYLTGLLILAAVGLFLTTALAGRVWCGYACPQTVWTDLFMWVEHLVEGDRTRRIRLDRSPLSLDKIWRKLAKHGIWLVISLVTGGAWIMYFIDAPTLVHGAVRLNVDSEVLFTIALFTTTTYVLAGWAREQVCTYMCPWPRIQGAMLDEDSLIVTYAAWRGEPRGPKRKTQGWDERGDCISCRDCVKACPVGIDIRDGQQMECIGCGLCVDACNGIMERIGRPGGLVSFDTHSNQIARAAAKPIRYRLVRPRTILYSLMLLVVSGLMLGILILRPRLDISVLRDRAPLYVMTADGGVRNAYTFKISNMTRQRHDYALTVSGLPVGAVLAAVGQDGEDRQHAVRLAAPPDTVATYRVTVKVAAGEVREASIPVTFTLRAERGGETARHASVFLTPGK